MRKPILYILCGCPGSGKTTWAHHFMQNIHAVYISRDEIRFSLVKENELYFSREDVVFATFAREIAEKLRNGENVIADATHLNKKSRRKLIYGIDRQGIENYQIIFVYFNISIEECLWRNAKREGRARVPEEVMPSMYNNMRAPNKEEDSRCIEVWEVRK